MSTVPTSDTRLANPEPSFAAGEVVPQASRIVVTDPPGEPTTLTLYRDDDERPLGCIVLGPADAVRIAHDLTGAALRRYGRAPTEETQ